MLDCSCCVWGESNVCYDTKNQWVAGVACAGQRCKVELLAHAIGRVTNLVEVGCVGCKLCQSDMMEDGRRIVQGWVGIAEVVNLCVECVGGWAGCNIAGV